MLPRACGSALLVGHRLLDGSTPRLAADDGTRLEPVGLARAVLRVGADAADERLGRLRTHRVDVPPPDAVPLRNRQLQLVLRVRVVLRGGRHEVVAVVRLVEAELHLAGVTLAPLQLVVRGAAERVRADETRDLGLGSLADRVRQQDRRRRKGGSGRCHSSGTDCAGRDG